MRYTIHEAIVIPEGGGDWDSAAWRRVEIASINNFHPASSDFRPKTKVKMCWDTRGICVLFQVTDCYILSTRLGVNGEVHRDSCVELFLQPMGKGGYFAFEFNAGGAMKAQFIEDWTRVGETSFKKYKLISDDDCAHVDVFHSLPALVETEIKIPTVWRLEAFIPFSVLRKYATFPDRMDRQLWKGNFYKCAEDNSKPHWGAWEAIVSSGQPNYHNPRCFGDLEFA